ncbi:fatty-acid amide hydrolase 2-like isoform X2 [Frieseomelitta varia]|uniref:fatty-acid amide hydrolase 2-like isoform X2 n=1 Tax=Frieseomelitta varia TaxID=561572 RepID=UPI001CB69421|nr:fatty-acid amide hydrolase 2-like isoform X2 [Frieseomelitta varia]
METSAHTLDTFATNCDYLDMINLVIQKLLKYGFLLLSCILTPILRLQRFKKQKRIPTIKNHLLLISATKIARAIRRKQISSEEVVRAYVERCIAVNPVLNAIVDQRYDTAIEEARKVDEFLASTPTTEEELAREKPLLGVPITVKESFAVKGMSHSAGVKKNSSHRATRDAEVVSLVRKAGAIVTVVSNTPELCLHFDSINHVTGTTWNPYDTNKTCGGSSGGEGALISSAASVVGVASDTAGSARFPALFCGVFGHKTTPDIIPGGDHIPDFKSSLNFSTCTMARYAEDLSLMLKNMCQSEKVRKNLEQKVSLKEIRYFYLDHCCPITNSLNEDIKQAINKLKIHIEETYNLKVEKVRLPSMRFTFALFMVLLETKSSLTEEIDRMELLDNNGVLIFPTFVSPALYIGESSINICNILYLGIANALALPSTHCPMGINKAGLPVGLQIMANTNNDHLTIAVAEEIERAFGGWQPPPMSPV